MANTMTRGSANRPAGKSSTEGSVYAGFGNWLKKNYGGYIASVQSNPTPTPYNYTPMAPAPQSQQSSPPGPYSGLGDAALRKVSSIQAAKQNAETQQVAQPYGWQQGTTPVSFTHNIGWSNSPIPTIEEQQAKYDTLAAQRKTEREAHAYDQGSTTAPYGNAAAWYLGWQRDRNSETSKEMAELESSAYEYRVGRSVRALRDANLTDAYNELRKAEAYSDWARDYGKNNRSASTPAGLESYKYDAARVAELRKQLEAAGVDYELLKEYEEREIKNRKNATDTQQISAYASALPGLATAVSVPMAAVQGVDYLAQLPKAFSGSNARDLSTYTPMSASDFAITNAVSAIRDTVAGDLAKTFDAEILGQNVASFLYQTGTSMADSLLQIAAFGGAGSLVSMGTSAAANTMRETIQRGGTNWQALLNGTAAGVAEALFEKFSVENLLSQKNISGIKSLIGEVFKQSGVEASEEFATEIANIFSDALIMGSKSNWQASVDYYRSQGMDQEKAWQQTFLDNLKQVGFAAAGGFFSGLGMGGGQSLRMYAGTQQTGARIRESGQTMPLLLTGLRMPAYSDAFQTAHELIEQVDQKKKPLTDGQIGALYQEIGEAQQEMEKTGREILDRTGKGEGSFGSILSQAYMLPEDTYAHQLAVSIAEAGGYPSPLTVGELYAASQWDKGWDPDFMRGRVETETETETEASPTVVDTAAGTSYTDYRQTATDAYRKAFPKITDKKLVKKTAAIQKFMSGEEMTADDAKALALTEQKMRDVFTQITGIPLPSYFSQHTSPQQIADVANQRRQAQREAEAQKQQAAQQRAATVVQQVRQAQNAGDAGANLMAKAEAAGVRPAPGTPLTDPAASLRKTAEEAGVYQPRIEDLQVQLNDDQMHGYNDFVRQARARQDGESATDAELRQAFVELAHKQGRIADATYNRLMEENQNGGGTDVRVAGELARSADQSAAGEREGVRSEAGRAEEESGRGAGSVHAGGESRDRADRKGVSPEVRAEASKREKVNLEKASTKTVEVKTSGGRTSLAQIDDKTFAETQTGKDLQELFDALGVEVHGMLGDARNWDADGAELPDANGYSRIGGSNPVVFTRLDHPYFTGTQFGYHEGGHQIISLSPGVFKQAREALFNKLPASEYEALVRAYAEDYYDAYKSGPGGKPRTEGQLRRLYLEEAICDAYAGMDRNGAKASQYHDLIAPIMDAAVKEIRQGRESAEDVAGVQDKRAFVRRVYDRDPSILDDAVNQLFKRVPRYERDRIRKRYARESFPDIKDGEVNRALSWVASAYAGEIEDQHPADWYHDIVASIIDPTARRLGIGAESAAEQRAKNDVTLTIAENGEQASLDGIPLATNTAESMTEDPRPFDYTDARHSVTTTPDWKKNYLQIGGEKASEVIKVLEDFTAQMVANDAILGYVPTGSYAYNSRGPLRANTEYVITFDMDASCPRTFQFLNYRNELQRRAGRPLSFNESIQLIELMRAYGQQIPCSYCYVENKRVQLANYYLNWFNFRNAVLSAETDDAARKQMYSYDAKKGTLTSAAEKQFNAWRKGDRSYRPSASDVWVAMQTARNSVMNWLDQNAGKYRMTPPAKIAEVVCDHFNVTEKNAVTEIQSYVNAWVYDRDAGVPHTYATVNDERVSEVNERALTLHHTAMYYANSASSSRGVDSYMPYTDQLKNFTEFKRRIEAQGGVRKHSSNDFRMDYVQDYFLFFADLAAGGWTGHTYTKNVDYVKIFGRTGDRINVSIAFSEDGRGNVIENQQEGMDWRSAKQLRKDYAENVGVMAMVTSNAQLSFALNADWIDMIIPFHASGLNKAVWYNLHSWTDYTSKQHERFFNSEEMTQQLNEAGVTVPKGAKAGEIQELYDKTFGIKRIYNADGKLIKPAFLPGSYEVNGQTIPGHKNDLDTYLRLCREYGVAPRFQGILVDDGHGNQIDITEHPNYMRVVKETARTDTPQKPIQFNFNEVDPALGMTPFEYAMQRMQEEAENGGYANTAEDPFGIVDEFEREYLDKNKPLPADLDLEGKPLADNLDRLLTDRAKAFKAGLDEMRAQEAERQARLLEESAAKPDTGEAGVVEQSDSRLSVVTPQQNKAYLAAVKRGDMITARRMVEDAAKAAGFTNAIPEQTRAYTVRTGAAPKQTIKVYKVFTLADDGSPTALFVSGTERLPQNVWLDAVPAWHFTAKNGLQYVPSTQNPYTDGGKTGGQVEIPSQEVRDELIRRGFLPEGSTAKNITALAYRPGWHAGDLPFFPQGGMKIEGSTYENAHRYNQVVFECEMAADRDYTTSHVNKDGKTVYHDMETMPESGYYKFATNPMANAQDLGTWVISGALKINRALSEEEVNEILRRNGRAVQEWQRYQDAAEKRGLSKADRYAYEHSFGAMDLRRLGYTGAKYDAARKTLAPVTYDDNGDVIPLSERFNPEKTDDVRYSISPDLQKWLDLQNQYGVQEEPPGSVRPTEVPVRTKPNNKVSETVPTVMGAAVTPESRVPTIQSAVVGGKLEHIPIENKVTERKAERWVENLKWHEAARQWMNAVDAGKANADLVARGAVLLNNAGNGNASGEEYTDLLVHYATLLRHASQATQAANILKKMSPQAKLYEAQKVVNQLNEKLGEKFNEETGEWDGIRINPELIEEYLKAETDAERDAILDMMAQNVADQIRAKPIDWWTAIRYLNMLGNVRTQVRNVLGNAFFQPVRMIKDSMAGLVEAGLQKAGVNIERTASAARDADTWRVAGDLYDLYEKAILAGGKYNDASGTDFEGMIDKYKRVFDNTGVKLWDKYPGWLLEKYRWATDKAMDVGDSIFCKFTFRDSLARFMAANHTTWAEASDELRTRAVNKAIKDAAEATYRDNNAISNAIARAFRGKDTPKFFKWLGEGVLPFRKTPANIALRAYEYSPLSAIENLIKSGQMALGKGKGAELTGNDLVNRWCKTFTGTGLALIGYALAAAGRLIGGAPEDDKKKALFEQMGNQKYSLVIGNKTLTIDWAAPEVIPLFLGANFAQAALENGWSWKEGLASLMQIADPLIEMSMLQGINDALENASTYGTDSAIMSFVANALWSYASQGLTNTLIGQGVRAFGRNANTRMQTYVDKNADIPPAIQRAIGKTSAKVPVWDYNQIPYIDAWGDPQENASSKAWNIVLQFFSPSYVSEKRTNAVLEEIKRLSEVKGIGGSVILDNADKSFKMEGETKYLTADEYLTYAITRGQTAKACVAGLVGGDSTAAKIYSGLSDEQKAEMIKKIYDFSNQVAKQAAVGYEPDKWVLHAQEAAEYGVSPETYVMAYVLGNEDKKDLQQMQALYSLPGLTETQVQSIAQSMGIGKTTNNLTEAEVQQKIDDLPTPEEQAAVAAHQETLTAAVQSSSLWGQATPEQQASVQQQIDSLAKGDSYGQKAQAKIDEGKQYGLDETEYMTFRLSLKMADTNGNGSYTNAEVEAAIRAIPGLSTAEKNYLWIAAGKNPKSTPVW